jgi:Fis1 C-terminal tetratricopeptide repeat
LTLKKVSDSSQVGGEAFKKRLGLAVLLTVSCVHIEIYQQAPERRRECLYYLALGHYKMSNYIEAKKFNQQLLMHEPKNSQAIELNKSIDEKVSRGMELERREKMKTRTHYD